MKVAPSWGLLALAAVLVVYAFPMQGRGAPQTSHYALVKSLSRGTPVIDETRFETGDVPTTDNAYHNGHYFSNKAPGLAFFVLPAYLVLEHVGMRTQGDPTNVLWVLSLVGAVLPTILLLVLVGRLGDEVAPRYGSAAAVALGLGTLLLPYGTMLFAHSLSTLCGFAAFFVLWRERRGRPRVGLVALGGVLAGLGVVAEYPLALCAGVLGIYAVARSGIVSRALSYAAGLLVGVLPLLLYQQWAFGSPFRTSYSVNVVELGSSGHERVAGGVSPYLEAPTVSSMTALLFSQWGLVTLCPIVVAAGVGLVQLYRRGWRAEALTCTGVVACYLVYAGGVYTAWQFGQAPPGPRYLIPMLPFLGVALAVAFSAAPLPAAFLGLVSAGVMFAVTMTRPLAAWDGHVVDRLLSPALEGYSPMIPALVGVTGWYDVLPAFAAVLAALVFSALATPRPEFDRRSLASLSAALIAWVVVVESVVELVDRRILALAGAVAVALFAVASAATVMLANRGRPA